MKLPLIVLGAGGHARVLLDILLSNGENIIGLTCPEPDKINTRVLDVPIIGDDEAIFAYTPDSIRLVNGIGSIKSTAVRRAIFERFTERGYSFANAVHPYAILSRFAEVSEGVQVMAGAVIQVGTIVGKNCIINTKASVDHDCIIGAHVHIAPGVTISGGARVDDGAHIGTGASVIQGVHIGKNSIVGAGAVVLKNVPEAVTVVGVPAKVV